MTREVTTDSPEATQLLAREIGSLCVAGDVISLVGELGAGKTTFVKGLADGLRLDPKDIVRSPTFTLIMEHFSGRYPLFHFDMYRLSGSADVYDLGFTEYLELDGVVVVEWGDRIREMLPENHLEITLEAGADANGRRILFAAHGDRAEQLLLGIRSARSGALPGAMLIALDEHVEGG